MATTIINTGRFSQHVRRGITASYEQRQDYLCNLLENALKSFSEKVTEYPFDEFCWSNKELIVSVSANSTNSTAYVQIACIAPEDEYLIKRALVSEPDFIPFEDEECEEISQRSQKFSEAVKRGKNFDSSFRYTMDINVEKYI